MRVVPNEGCGEGPIRVTARVVTARVPNEVYV